MRIQKNANQLSKFHIHITLHHWVVLQISSTSSKKLSINQSFFTNGQCVSSSQSYIQTVWLLMGLITNSKSNGYVNASNICQMMRVLIRFLLYLKMLIVWSYGKIYTLHLSKYCWCALAVNSNKYTTGCMIHTRCHVNSTINS